MSTILDALRKLQRERAAQSPAKDLRGSITTETSFSRARPRGAGSRWVGAALLLLVVGGGGYWLHHSGQVSALLARFSKSDVASPAEVDEAEGDDVSLQQQMAELDAAQRQQDEANAAEARTRSASGARVRAPEAAIPPTDRAAVAPSAGAAPPVSADTPEIAAERARLEAALANARAAQAAQRQAELDAAAAQATAAAAPPSQAAASAPPPPPVVAVAAPKPKSAARVVAAAPKAAVGEPAPRRSPARSAEPAPPESSFPDVRVESIRWHPVPARRIASLRFEQQNVPEAREGDIVSGVLVYRIDPGAVELRVGSAQRTVSPGP